MCGCWMVLVGVVMSSHREALTCIYVLHKKHTLSWKDDRVCAETGHLLLVTLQLNNSVRNLSDRISQPHHFLR